MAVHLATPERRIGCRGAVLTLACLWLMGLAGCAATRPRPPARPAPEQWARLQALSRSAQTALERGEFDSARALLGQLIAEDPSSAEAHHRLGQVNDAQGLLPQAEAEFNRALELDPEYVDALIGLARTQNRQGRYSTALDHLDLALEIDPGRAEAHVDRGRVLEGLGRTDEALQAYYEALQREPDSAGALLRVAQLQIARDHPEAALARLDPLTELRPDDPDVRHARGRTLLDLGRIPEAVADLEAAASALPARPDVLYHLALAQEQARDLPAARRAADRAAQLAPESAAARDLADRLRR